MVENCLVGAKKILEELSRLLSSSYGRRVAGGGALDGKVAMSRPKANPGKRADSIRTREKKVLPAGFAVFLFLLMTEHEHPVQLWPPLPPGAPPAHTKVNSVAKSDALRGTGKHCEMLFSTDTSPELIKALTAPTSDKGSLQEMGKFIKAVAISHGFSLPRQMRIIFSTGKGEEDETLATDVYICSVTHSSGESGQCLLHIYIECNGFCTKVGLVSRMGEDGLDACMKLWTKSYFEQLY